MSATLSSISFLFGINSGTLIPTNKKKKSDFNHKFTIVIKQKGTIKLILEFGGRGLELHHIGVKAIAYK